MDEPVHEQERLAALERYDVLDTPPEEAFDRITRMVQQIFGVSMSTITLIDGHRQWFKSRRGIADCETAKGPALCAVAIKGAQPLVVPDTFADSRFVQNPFVTGAPNIRFYAGIPLRDPAGHCIGTLCAMDHAPRQFAPGDIALLSDLASIVMSELELRALAMSDSLTGALSRRAFRDEASRAIALARRHRHDLSCAIFDLDHFKAVNDTHGHAVGDLVLKACVDVCRQELRETDVIGRIGGEEFAVLLPHTDNRSAMQVIDKVRAALTRIYVPSSTGPVKISASFGCTTLDPSASDIDELLVRSDQALYAAKAAGRNTCVAWQPAAPVPSGVSRRVFKAGRITFNTGHSTIDCTVRGLSNAGASIDVVSSADIPEQFKLQILADDLSRICRVETRRDKRLDVAFE